MPVADAYVPGTPLVHLFNMDHADVCFDVPEPPELAAELVSDYTKGRPLVAGYAPKPLTKALVLHLLRRIGAAAGRDSDGGGGGDEAATSDQRFATGGEDVGPPPRSTLDENARVKKGPLEDRDFAESLGRQG